MLHVLIVDDDPGDLRLLQRELEKLRPFEALSVIEADCISAALQTLADEEVDLVLLDLGLSDSQGIETLDIVHNARNDVPIVVLTGLDSEETGLEALRHGASDYLVKGKHNADMLLRTIRYSLERKRLERELVRQARHDPLTGALNRRAFEEVLQHAVGKARQAHRSSLILFDIDHFKQVNDTLGHRAGDDLLVRIVDLTRRQLRSSDSLARLGGDEFVVLLDNTDLGAARIIAERVRNAVTELSRELPCTLCPSLSIGAVEIDGDQEPEALINHADACMYQAKTNGRNRVSVA